MNKNSSQEKIIVSLTSFPEAIPYAVDETMSSIVKLLPATIS